MFLRLISWLMRFPEAVEDYFDPAWSESRRDD